MIKEEQAGLIEAILFLESEPQETGSLARYSDLKTEQIDEILELLKKRYNDQKSGLELVQLGEGYMITPRQQFWDQLKDRYGKKNDNKLSRAALETLSIIAYSQPITKTEIENIRGVSADGMMKILGSRKLIKHVGKKDVPGKPIQYGTTKEFLKYFKISSIANLPKLDELNQEKFEDYE